VQYGLATLVDFFACLYQIRLETYCSCQIPLTAIKGYLAIFIFAFDTGHYILPADPYYAFRQNRKPSIKPKQRKLAMILFSYAIVWSIGFMVALVWGIEVSRQMANLGYVFWVAVYNTGFLCLFQIVELMFFDRYWVKEGLYVPHIMEAFNKNGLAVFLLVSMSNVFEAMLF